MAAMPPRAAPAPDLTLSAGQLRTLLAIGGYRGDVIASWRRHLLPAGCRVMLQFGDQLARDGDGPTQVVIRCSLELNGDAARIGEVSYWQIRKVLPVTVDGERVQLALDADLLLGSAIRLDDVLAQGAAIVRHLKLLLSDARRTLSHLPVDDRTGEDTGPPVVRIEARFAADLAAGRSGLVAPEPGGPAPVRTTTRHLAIGMAACDCLADHVLPELAQAVRAVIAQARSTRALPDHHNLRTTTHPHSAAI
ncbi:hypothetical protein I6F35_04540 [Bradyrhizobium sp. BRP22]|uniref:hypothetical protein n=1 Tax=Bradyrhizobium sp. BRP22 TaxID=2793821 RepID=UPI001CD3A895|nr:hypothetical protein [Bradyrhizobium sp. BRP22]MCA1452486.1 hypothetical protein [Bradyrhizobium sp. BRP22]